MQQERENKAVFRVKPDGQTEKDAFAAVEAEDKGNKETALARWQAVKEREGADSPWTAIADKHLAEWNALDQIEEKFAQDYERIPTKGEPELTERQRLAFLAWRAKNSEVGDDSLAKSNFKALRDATAICPGARNRWYLYAALNIQGLSDVHTDKDKLKEKVHEKLKGVRKQLNQQKISKINAWLVPMDILALYGRDGSMEELVKEADQFLKDLSK
jgi:hypothetical protein